MKNITKGDILTRRKGLVTHYGVYIGNDLVLDILPNQSKRGCRLVTFEEFSDGKAVSVVKCEPVDGFEDRINEVLTLGYQLLSNILPLDYDQQMSELVSDILVNELLFKGSISPISDKRLVNIQIKK